MSVLGSLAGRQKRKWRPRFVPSDLLLPSLRLIAPNTMDLLVAAARGLRPLSRNLSSRLHSRPRASHFSSSSSSTPSSSFRAKSATASASASSVNQLRRYTSQPCVSHLPFPFPGSGATDSLGLSCLSLGQPSSTASSKINFNRQ